MTHAWMFSGDSKEAFKNYTLCSMKANEQKSKYEGKLQLQEAWFHLGPVNSSPQIHWDGLVIAGTHTALPPSLSRLPAGHYAPVPKELKPLSNKWWGKERG